MQRDATKRAAHPDQAVESTPPKKKQQKPALSDNVKSAEGDAFASLKITSFDGLIGKRVLCPGCNKSQKNYCCRCLKVIPGCSIPCLKLPIHLDIVHHVSFHRMLEIVSLMTLLVDTRETQQKHCRARSCSRAAACRFY